MAEKKYVDLTGLQNYDAKIKALIDSKDAATLAAAKSHSESLSTNYDASGAAATAESNAKAYTDAQVATATQAAAAAQTQADKGVTDAAAAKTAAEKAQAEVDALETYVGTLPEGTQAASVVDYINKKTEGIATDAALGELQSQLSAAQAAIDAIEEDYLVEADKTELQGAIDTEEAARIAADAGLETRLEKVETFFVTTEGETLDSALDTLVEIQQYVDTHGAAAEQMVTNISANAEAIAAEKTRAEGAEEALGGRINDVVADVTALEAKFGDGDGSVSDMIADAVAGEATLRDQADKALDAKITANATAAANAASAAATAQGEVDALETVVAGKVAQADHDALAGRVTTAEGKITTLEGASHTHANADVLANITAANIADWADAVAKEHEHSNKAVLDTITQAKVTNWDNTKAEAIAYTDEKIAEFKPVTTEEINALFTA